MTQLPANLSLALDAAGMGTWVWNLKTGKVRHFGKTNEILGLKNNDDEDLVQSRVKNFVHPEDRDYVIQALEAAANDRTPYDVEFRTIKPNGEISWISAKGKATYDQEGKPECLVGVLFDITSRKHLHEDLQLKKKQLGEIAHIQKKTEIALKESEEDFRTTFNLAAVGISHVGLDGKLLKVNQTFCNITGFSNAELLDKTFGDITHPEDTPKDWALAHRLLNGEFPSYSMEKRYFRKDGALIWVHLTVSLRRNEGGEPQHFISCITDITDRKNAEQALAQKEDRFSKVAHLSNLGVWYCDLPFSDLIWDERVKEHFGLSPDATVTIQTFFDRLHPDDRERVRQEIDRSISEHTPYEIEYRTVGPSDGRVRWIRALGGSSYDSRGKPIRFDGITLDISKERKIAHDLLKAQEDVRENETRFGQLADAMPQNVWSTDAEGNADYYNEKWFSYTGQTLNEAKGLGWQNAVHPDDLQSTKDAWEKAVKRTGFYKTEYRLRRHDGAYLWHLARGLAIKNTDGKIIRWYGTSTDIQEQKQTEEDLKQSNAELARFAFVASHDLKEPLRVISNYSQMLQMRYKDRPDEKADLYIKYITSGVERMYALITDVLAFSRIGATPEEFSFIDCEVMVQDILANLEASIQEARATIEFKNLPKLFADRGQMVQLFQNLISNAIKYRNSEPPLIKIEATKEQGSYLFSIQDNGIGIAPEYYEKIFVIFERLHRKEDFSGTGIGLAICKKIVERHSGSIWVQSQVGIGSTFYFRLPERPQRERGFT